jgi:hypothetical protein
VGKTNQKLLTAEIAKFAKKSPAEIHVKGRRTLQKSKAFNRKVRKVRQANLYL